MNQYLLFKGRLLNQTLAPNRILDAYGAVAWEGVITGIEDRIVFGGHYCSSGNEVRIEPGILSRYCVSFEDIPPHGDNITEYTWSLQVQHEDGFLEVLADVDGGGNGSRWNFTFNSSMIPPGYNYDRNSNGDIVGKVVCVGFDDDGYYHRAEMDVGIGYKPNSPLILDAYVSDGIVNIDFLGSNSVDYYKVYYDDDNAAPYDGTGANEGNSPISNITNTSFSLTGLNTTFNDHTILIAAVNSYGESDLSEAFIAYADGPEGSTFANPIIIGTLSNGTTNPPAMSNHVSNGFGNTYDGLYNQDSDDIFFKFYIPVEGTVTLKTCSSIDTYLHMLNHQGFTISSNDNGYSCQAVASVPDDTRQNVLPLSNLQSSITVQNLSPRYYYAVVEGKSSNAGLINLIIEFTPKSTDQDVVWEDFFRTSVSGTTIRNTNTSSGWKSSAASANRIPSNTDGHFEFVVPSPSRNRMIGFSENNYNDGTWRNHWETIQYNMYLRSNGNISIYHSASSQGSAGTYSAGDLIRIERAGSQIKYKVNGAVRFTSSCPYSKSLIIDFCLYTPNDFFDDVKISAPPSMSMAALGYVPTATDLERIRNNAQPILEDSAASSLFSTLKVSPNPTRSKVDLSMESEVVTEAQVFIYHDRTGAVMRNRAWLLRIGRNSKSLQIRDLPFGTYIIEVVVAGSSKQIRVLKY
ncbi:MAG: hypothetical protein AAGG59_02175 [Bacteroidota bacterium]